MSKICLNMIVKNESKVILRCLASVKDIIDYWVIVDTGSSDDSQTIIKKFLEDVPGELHQRPWANFERNRNEALELARGKSDYIFFIDADEVLLLSKPLNKNALCKQFYVMLSRGRDTEHYRIQLINQDRGWLWMGVLHESIVNREKMEGEILPNAIIDFSAMDGYRFSNPKKFIDDAGILEGELKKDPDNSRYVFYLAQSYFNAREFEKALKNFKKRASMEGEEGEMYITLFCIAYLQERLKMDDQTIIDSYLRAIEYDLNRAEALQGLATFFYNKKWPLLAFLVAKQGLLLSKPIELTSHSFHFVYDYSLLLLAADSAREAGFHEESFQMYRQLLKNEELPKSIRERINTAVS